MKAMKRIAMIIMVVAVAVILANPVTADAATKVKLNKTKATITITDKKANPTATLKVKGTSKKAKWSTSDKKVATVKNGKVTAKKAGKATITCKVNGKTLKCKVTVKDKRTPLDITVIHTDTFNRTTEKYDNKAANQLVVKWKGKDVTKQAKYDSHEKGDSSDVAFIKKDGSVGLYKDGTFDVTVTYEGIETTVKLKVETKKVKYYFCSCGMLFDTSEECAAHVKAAVLEYGRTGIETDCGSSGFVEYRDTVVTKVK